MSLIGTSTLINNSFRINCFIMIFSYNYCSSNIRLPWNHWISELWPDSKLICNSTFGNLATRVKPVSESITKSCQKTNRWQQSLYSSQSSSFSKVGQILKSKSQDCDNVQGLHLYNMKALSLLVWKLWPRLKFLFTSKRMLGHICPGSLKSLKTKFEQGSIILRKLVNDDQNQTWSVTACRETCYQTSPQYLKAQLSHENLCERLRDRQRVETCSPLCFFTTGGLILTG